jgi:hypothetical protein
MFFHVTHPAWSVVERGVRIFWAMKVYNKNFIIIIGSMPSGIS